MHRVDGNKDNSYVNGFNGLWLNVVSCLQKVIQVAFNPSEQSLAVIITTWNLLYFAPSMLHHFEVVDVVKGIL